MKTKLALLCLCLTAACRPDGRVPDFDAGGGGGEPMDASMDLDSGRPDSGQADAGVDAGRAIDAGIVDPGVISDQLGDIFQGEPAVAAGPDGQRVAAWLNLPRSVGRYQVAYAVSLDEGRSFGPIRQAPTPDGGWSRSPALTSGPGGFWLAWPAIHLAGSVRDDVHMLASHLAYGASTLEEPITLDDGTPFVRYGPSIVELDSKTLVAAYTESSAMIARRDSAGNITRTSLNEPAFVSLCTDGKRVYAAFLNAATVALRWSDDEGQTWPAANVHLFDPDPDLAYEQPRCAAWGDSVWVMFGADPNLDPTSQAHEVLDAVLLVRSKDRGMTWSSELDVKPASAQLAMLPNLIAADGKVYVTFYTGQMPGDTAGAMVLVRAGDSLEASVVVHQPLTFMTARSPPSWQGDSVGISAYGGHLDVTYANDTGTASHVALFGIDGAAIGTLTSP